MDSTLKLDENGQCQCKRCQARASREKKLADFERLVRHYMHTGRCPVRTHDNEGWAAYEIAKTRLKRRDSLNKPEDVV